MSSLDGCVFRKTHKIVYVEKLKTVHTLRVNKDFNRSSVWVQREKKIIIINVNNTNTLMIKKTLN